MLSNVILRFCQVHVVENLVVELMSLDLFLAFSWWWCSACYTCKDWLTMTTLKNSIIPNILCFMLPYWHVSQLSFNFLIVKTFQHDFPGKLCILFVMIHFNYKFLRVLIFIWIFECLIYSNVCRLKHVLTVVRMLFKFFSC